MTVIHRIETNQRGEQSPVGFCQPITHKIPL
jgi:hypothetical protein